MCHVNKTVLKHMLQLEAHSNVRLIFHRKPLALVIKNKFPAATTKQHWKWLLFSGVYLSADGKQKAGKPDLKPRLFWI